MERFKIDWLGSSLGGGSINLVGSLGVSENIFISLGWPVSDEDFAGRQAGKFGDSQLFFGKTCQNNLIKIRPKKILKIAMLLVSMQIVEEKTLSTFDKG